MKHILTLLAALAGVASLLAQSSSPSSSPATGEAHHIMIKAGDLKWGDAPSSLPPGAKLAVLAGDPAAAGMFTIRLKMPAGYKVPLHTHPTDEILTVISGGAEFKTGADATPEKLGPGGFVVMAAGMQHAASADTETILQVSSVGPFVINYVNPSDDPRNAK